MTVPGIVEDALGGAEVLTRVSLGGDDELFVTPDHTYAYRAGGVLSDESVEQYRHDVERLTVSEGRRKATIRFEYPVEDARELSVANGDLEPTLQPVLASVLRAAGATDPDERFHQAFRFSELTLVVTSDRLFKHVGSALWDGEYDDYHFEDVSDVDYEPGDVATGVVLSVGGRKERVKTPNDRLPEVRRALESALFAYHDVSAADELAAKFGDDDADPADRVEEDPVVSFGAGVDPIDAGTHPGTVEREGTDDAVPADGTDAADAGEGPVADGPDADPTPTTSDGARDDGDDGRETADVGDDRETANADDGDGDPDEATGEAATAPPDTPFTEDVEPAADEALREEVGELRAAVERQNELLQRQQRAIERLVEELRGE